MFGTTITDWAAVEGPYHAGSGTEVFWLVLAIVICAGALVFGSAYEKRAYRRAK